MNVYNTTLSTRLVHNHTIVIYSMPPSLSQRHQKLGIGNAVKKTVKVFNMIYPKPIFTASNAKARCKGLGESKESIRPAIGKGRSRKYVNNKLMDRTCLLILISRSPEWRPTRANYHFVF